MNNKYPFDPSKSHHFIIAGSLALWIFLFLYFTEPLDVQEFNASEKLIYLPWYGLLGAFCYILLIPIQHYFYIKAKKKWKIIHEITFVFLFVIISFIITRTFYLYVVMIDIPNPYTFFYYLRAIFLPAVLIILPIVIFGRYAFGKYRNKQLEAKKIEITGTGNYENLRLLLDDLICVQSSDNYIEVLYFSDNTLKKSLIRTKISVIAKSFPDLIRTHRSYIINPFHFRQWKIEKGKFSIELSHEVCIPISKTYLSTVKKTINSTTK